MNLNLVHLEFCSGPTRWLQQMQGHKFTSLAPLIPVCFLELEIENRAAKSKPRFPAVPRGNFDEGQQFVPHKLPHPLQMPLVLQLARKF